MEDDSGPGGFVSEPDDRELTKILDRSGVDWLIWYVATSRDISDTLVDIQTKWTLDDLMSAHQALAAKAKIKALMIERASKKMET